MAEERKGSSWRRWTEETAPAGDDDLEVTLAWPAEEGGQPAAAHRPTAPTEAEHDQDDDDGDGDGDDGDRDFGELVPAVPLLPSIAGRVDALDGHLKAIGMRLDVLGSAVAALRNSIGDRVDAYAESAAAATQQADDALAEHRRTTQKALGELRRGVTKQDEGLRRLAGQVEELAGEITDAVSVVRSKPVAATKASVDLSPLEGRLAALETTVDRIATLVEVVVDTMPTPAAVAPGASAEVDLAPVASQLERLTALVETVVDAIPEPGEELDPMVADVDLSTVESRLDRLTKLVEAMVERWAPDLSPLENRMTAVEQAVANIATLVEVVVDTMPASAEGSGADLADRVADAVAARLGK